jgi:hypothetical protein
MIEEVELTEDQREQLFMDWMKRPVVLNPKKARALIDDLEQVIIELRASLNSKSRLEKNMVYNQIENRKAQIKYAQQFL